MKVVPIRSRTLFGNFYPWTDKLSSEDLKFFAGAGLTHWAPTLMFCYVIGQAVPFYLLACNQALGVLLGILLHENPSPGPLSCVPVVERPGGARLKKAA